MLKRLLIISALAAVGFGAWFGAATTNTGKKMQIQIEELPESGFDGPKLYWVRHQFFRIHSEYEPVVTKTNGGWIIEFKQKQAPVAANPVAVAALLSKQDLEDMIAALEDKRLTGEDELHRRRSLIAELLRLLREAFPPNDEVSHGVDNER